MTRKRILELAVLYPAMGLLVLGGIAAVTPRWDGPRLHARETAAVATLRNIASAERQFRELRTVDRDGDGRAEYGTLAELAGSRDLRGDPALGRLDPALISGAFRHPDPDGTVTRSGYRFRILLPGGDGQPLCPDADPAAFDRVRPDAAARGFLVHAWPVTHEPGCARTFLAGPDGRVFATDHGETLGPRGPDPASGLRPEAAGNLLGPLAEGVADAGGLVWTEVR
jgi:hypothetical protein